MDLTADPRLAPGPAMGSRRQTSFAQRAAGSCRHLSSALVRLHLSATPLALCLQADLAANLVRSGIHLRLLLLCASIPVIEYWMSLPVNHHF
jgi:hypothetical protein